MFVPSTTRAAFIAVAVLAFTPAALASDAAPQKMPSTFTALLEKEAVDVMHMMDAGKKGYVTKEEFMKFQEALFEKIDKDGDRKLTAPEFTDRG